MIYMHWINVAFRLLLIVTLLWLVISGKLTNAEKGNEAELVKLHSCFLNANFH